MLLLLLPMVHVAMQSSMGVLPDSLNEAFEAQSGRTLQIDESESFDSYFQEHAFTQSDVLSGPDPATGIMNPIQVEQSGYSTTGNISARTDTKSNTEQTLLVDTDHEWVASAANVDLWNLKKMYVENGTLEDGYPGVNINPTGSVSYHPLGWDAISTTTDIVQTQVASYSLGTESYVIVENQGTPMPPPSTPTYRHSVGTNISWRLHSEV